MFHFLRQRDHLASSAIGIAVVTAACTGALALADRSIAHAPLFIATWVGLAATTLAVATLCRAASLGRIGHRSNVAAGLFVVVAYTFFDGLHHQLFQRHPSSTDVWLAVEAVRTGAVPLHGADRVALALAPPLVAILLYAGLAVAARMKRAPPVLERVLLESGRAMLAIGVLLALYRGLTPSGTNAISNLLSRHVDHESAPERPVQTLTTLHAGRSFAASQFAPIASYAAHPEALGLSAARRPDIVLVHVESLRWDALTSELMPRTLAWRNTCAAPERHYSTGNATGNAAFGVVFGMSAAFHSLARESQVSPVTLVALEQLGYRRNVWYPNASLEFDGLLDALFRGRAEPHAFEAMPRHRADAAVLRGLIEDVKARSGEPRFDYVVLDATHYDYSYPESYERFVPAAALGVRIDPRTGDQLETKRFSTPLQRDGGPGQAVWNRYRNAVGFMDTQIDGLLHALLDDVDDGRRIVVVFGDHGEAFWDKGGPFGHSTGYTDAQTRVPLLMCGVGALTIRHRITSHADILPTIFDWMGVRAAHPFMTGKSWLKYERDSEYVILRQRTTSQGGSLGGAIVLPGGKYGFKDADPLSLMWATDLSDDPVEPSEQAAQAALAIALGSARMKMPEPP